MVKFVTSKIDNKVYSRHTGAFRKHLEKYGYDYQSYYETYLGNIEYCPYCGNKCRFLPHQMKYRKTCGDRKCYSKEISAAKKQFTDEKWAKQRENYQKTMANKSDQEIKNMFEKRKQTNMEKYGVDHPWKSKEIREKIKKTFRKKYGGDNFSNSLISDDIYNLLESKEWMYQKHINEEISCFGIGKFLNVSDITVKKYLKKHGIERQIYNSSYGEKSLASFIESLGINNIIRNSRDLSDSNFEIDIYLPDYNIAFEYCGLFWHSNYHEKITNTYHQEKYIDCKENDIKLITIFEDEWEEKQDIVKNTIKHLLNKNDQRRIFARNTTIKEITTKKSKEFFDNNHIQGYGKGFVKYGLYYNDELIAAMVFKKISDGVVLLNRYASNCIVVGGFSKLLKHFIRMYSNIKQIITFANLRWSEGDLYLKNGFEIDNFLEPDYEYIFNGDRYHKFNFRRALLPKKLKKFDPALSESKNCWNNNVFKIYDCGKIRFIYNV